MDRHQLNILVEQVLGTGGYISTSRNGTETVIGMDIPLGHKNRTKRLYIHETDRNVLLRYRNTREIRERSVFAPYREAIDTIKEMVEDGKRKVFSTEGKEEFSGVLVLKI